MNNGKSARDSVRAIVFDLGKVVFDFSFDSAVNSWAEAAGIDVAEVRKRYVWDGTFERYERGEIGLNEVHRNFVGQINREIPFESFEKAWLDMFRNEIPGIREILGRLSPRFRLVALSNTNADHARIWRRLYPEPLACFEKIFASNEIGTRKPEPRAFEIVMEYLGLDTGEVLFVDDYAENVDAAERFGLRALLFRDSAQLEGELQKEGLWPV